MRYNICILVLLLFVLSGCEKEINLEHMRPEPKLVLNCLAVQGDTPVSYTHLTLPTIA